MGIIDIDSPPAESEQRRIHPPGDFAASYRYSYDTLVDFSEMPETFPHLGIPTPDVAERAGFSPFAEARHLPCFLRSIHLAQKLHPEIFASPR